MPIPFQVSKLEEAPENVRSLYVQSGDVFVLDVDGAVSKARLDEFRDNNVKLMKDLEKFKNVDPAKYQELMSIQRQIEEKKLIDAGKIDEVVEQRVNTMRSTYDEQVNNLKESNNTLTRQLETLIIDNNVRDQAIKNGVLPSAVDDVLLRAKTTFKVQEGQAVALDAKGQVIYGKDGSTPKGISEWLTELKTAAPHLFQPSDGVGARGSRVTGGGGNTPKTAVGKITQGLGG